MMKSRAGLQMSLTAVNNLDVLLCYVRVYVVIMQSLLIETSCTLHVFILFSFFHRTFFCVSRCSLFFANR